MRKKSHVSLANHIIGECAAENRILHTGAFKLGSLAPDLVPSFITKKHQIGETFDILEKKTYKILDTYDRGKGLNKRRTKDMGVITHYIADYFTFPHNEQYEGSLKDHMHYEKELITALNNYVSSIDVDAPDKVMDVVFLENCSSAEDIFRYIRQSHNIYICMRQQRISSGQICSISTLVESDCEYIIRICRNVINAIMKLLECKPAYGTVCLSM